jgi:hypothetical protein
MTARHTLRAPVVHVLFRGTARGRMPGRSTAFEGGGVNARRPYESDGIRTDRDGHPVRCAGRAVDVTRARQCRTCSFGSNTITLTIAPGEEITLRTVAGSGVTNFETNATGDNSFQQCGTADNSNTTAINVTGDTASETLILDETSGLYFQDGSNNDIPSQSTCPWAPTRS